MGEFKMKKDKKEKKTLGQTVLELRTKYGWTQDELAWRSGINRTHIGRIERDETVPTIPTIGRLEAALGLPKLTLVGLNQGKLNIVKEKPKQSAAEEAIGKAFRGLEHELVMNMSEEELKYVSNAVNAFTGLIKK